MLMRLSGQTPILTIRTSTFLLLNLADFVLTISAIESGLGTKFNPVCANLPYWGMGLVKLAGVLLVTLLLRDRRSVMRLLNIEIGGVVLWNLLVLLIGLKI